MILAPDNEINLAGKLKNVSLGFVSVLIWVICVQAFLSLIMNVPAFLPHRSHVTLFGLFFACIVAPLWEELAFRVVPITITKIISPEAMFPVVLLSSLLFGWGHGYGSISLMFQGVTGFIFSVVYIKNNYCYVSAVTLHAAWNLFCFGFF